MGCFMGLELASRSEPSVTTIEPLKIASQPFWFWVKAGIGFTFGAGLMAFAFMVFWWTVILSGLIGFGALLRAH